MSTDSNFSFLTTETEIGGLIHTIDWSDSALGAPQDWPETLKMKLNTIMHSLFPMFIFWGEDLFCFYNDAFRPILGTDGKHPAIGKKASEVWEELWPTISPIISKVRKSGKSVWLEDKPFSFFRNGKLDKVYL